MLFLTLDVVFRCAEWRASGGPEVVAARKAADAAR